jgi:hypothetical protein
MTLDPTLEEMESFLRQNTGSMIDWTEYSTHYTMKIAVHYFSARHYTGQFSNLYQAICQIDYNSKDLELEDEDDEVHMMYDLLVKQYVK